MNVDRLTRVNELLKREIGDTLFRVIHENRFDLSAVTVTRVITSRNLKAARVMVSIRAQPHERDRMLAILRRHRGEIQHHISADIVLKYTPRLEFEMDTSIEEGDRVLALISKLEPSSTALPDEGGTPQP